LSFNQSKNTQEMGTETPNYDQLLKDIAVTALKAAQIVVGASNQAEVNQVAKEIKEAIDAAVLEDLGTPTPIEVVESSLKIVDDALKLAGKDALAADVEEVEVILNTFGGNGGHTLMAGIKTALQKVFAPKQYALAVLAAQGATGPTNQSGPQGAMGEAGAQE